MKTTRILTALKLRMEVTPNTGDYWITTETSTLRKCFQEALSLLQQLVSVNNRQAFTLASISSEAVSFEGQGPKTHCSELNLVIVIGELENICKCERYQASDFYARDKGNHQLR